MPTLCDAHALVRARNQSKVVDVLKVDNQRLGSEDSDLQAVSRISLRVLCPKILSNIKTEARSVRAKHGLELQIPYH